MATTILTSSKQRFNSLTGMRALAAGWVGLHHASGNFPQFSWLNEPARFGYLGVSFFFCLSGFVMQWTWHQGTTTRSFLARRVARIYPIAMLGLVISLIGWTYFRNPLAGYVGTRGSIPANVFLLEAWFTDPRISQAWDGVMWSLSCEAFFYVCSPLLLRLIERLDVVRCLLGIGCLFVVSATCQILLIPHLSPNGQLFFYFDPVARIPEYLMGALLCRAFILGLRPRFRHLTVAGVVGIAVPLWIYSIFVSSVTPYQSYLSESALVVIPGFLLVILLGASRDARPDELLGSRVLSGRSMVWLGDTSYAFYALHALALGVLVRILTNAHLRPTTALGGTAWSAVFIVLSIGVAAVARVIVEKPSQRLLLRVLIRQRPRLEAT